MPFFNNGVTPFGGGVGNPSDTIITGGHSKGTSGRRPSEKTPKQTGEMKINNRSLKISVKNEIKSIGEAAKSLPLEIMKLFLAIGGGVVEEQA